MTDLVVVDDDADIRDLLSVYLSKNGYTVQTFESAEALLSKGVTDQRLLILDVGLPGIDGLELCRRVRAESDVPIIMLTAASDDVDRILGLELGADDYMGKPFNPRELLARIKAALRRVTPCAPTKDTALVIDAAHRQASYLGKTLELTGAEFDLLRVLKEHGGGIVSRDELSRRLKGHAASPFDRSIDTLISRLRAKIMPLTDTDPIRSIRGKGYQLVLL